MNDPARILGLLLVAVLALGCASATVEEKGPAGDEMPPEDAEFVCHLDCSEREAAAYGTTEEEARAAARALVDTLCNPDDGQFFIFCDPIE